MGINAPPAFVIRAIGELRLRRRFHLELSAERAD